MAEREAEDARDPAGKVGRIAERQKTARRNQMLNDARVAWAEAAGEEHAASERLNQAARELDRREGSGVSSTSAWVGTSWGYRDGWGDAWSHRDGWGSREAVWWNGAWSSGWASRW